MVASGLRSRAPSLSYRTRLQIARCSYTHMRARARAHIRTHGRIRVSVNQMHVSSIVDKSHPRMREDTCPPVRPPTLFYDPDVNSAIS